MATGSQNSEAGSFAFLVHSQGTVNLNLPPEVDNPPLVRQRRRRTRFANNSNAIRVRAKCSYSPEDHAILEAEYAQNSKPDKAARMSIVNRVALGEKEVQVSICHPFHTSIRSRIRPNFMAGLSSLSMDHSG